MPKTIANARIKLTALKTKPANWKTPTAAELNAGIDLSEHILKSDYKFSAANSDTVDDAPLTAAGNAVTYGAGNFEAGVTVFRYYDKDGHADLAEDVAYAAAKVKGTELYLAERRGPEYDVPWAPGDEATVAIVITDNPQAPSDMGGYLKAVIPLGPQDFAIDVEVAA